MTNAEKITAKLNEYQDLLNSYSADATPAIYRQINEMQNSLIPFAKATPITRDEYESLLANAARLNDDDTIYRYEGGWWIGDNKLVWCLAHYARRAALIAERGPYAAPTDAMLGLELVSDGLPAGFREFHGGAEC